MGFRAFFVAGSHSWGCLMVEPLNLEAIKARASQATGLGDRALTLGEWQTVAYSATDVWPLVAEVERLRQAHIPGDEGLQDTITIPRPHVPFGPDHIPEREADADYLRSAVRNIKHLERGERIWGSNLTATIIKLLLDSAAALTTPEAQNK